METSGLPSRPHPSICQPCAAMDFTGWTSGEPSMGAFGERRFGDAEGGAACSWTVLCSEPGSKTTEGRSFRAAGQDLCAQFEASKRAAAISYGGDSMHR